MALGGSKELSNLPSLHNTDFLSSAFSFPDANCVVILKGSIH